MFIIKKKLGKELFSTMTKDDTLNGDQYLKDEDVRYFDSQESAVRHLESYKILNNFNACDLAVVNAETGEMVHVQTSDDSINMIRNLSKHIRF